MHLFNAQQSEEITTLISEEKVRWSMIAEQNRPELRSARRQPIAIVEFEKDPASYQSLRVVPIGSPADRYNTVMKKGDRFIVDFGEHYVGYLSLDLRACDTHVDAPVRFRLVFAEVPAEIIDPITDFAGDISCSWHQEEIINIDLVPSVFRLPRRYAFRYVQVELLSTSGWNGEFSLADIFCDVVSATSLDDASPLPDTLSDDIQMIDIVGTRTLVNCMQTVFEDGPKRDRRLWLGDFYLQTLANHYTVRCFNLEKRCIYLLAATAFEDGGVSVNVFEKPMPEAGPERALDYLALFIPTLHGYVQASGDMETLRDLWPLLRKQVEIIVAPIAEDGAFTIPNNPDWWLFVDWNKDLDKTTSFYGTVLFALRHFLLLTDMAGEHSDTQIVTNIIDMMSKWAKTNLYDANIGLFTSGPNHEVSWASQAWMVLGGVVEDEDARVLMRTVANTANAIKPAGPYCYHYVVEAFFNCGLHEEATDVLTGYWGDMIAKGATTFFEVHDPSDDYLTPYNCYQLNSYCHAWSATPPYFIRKYLM